MYKGWWGRGIRGIFKYYSIGLCQNIREHIEYLMEKHTSKNGHDFEITAWWYVLDAYSIPLSGKKK